MLSKPRRMKLYGKASGGKTRNVHSYDCISLRRGLELGTFPFRDGVNNGFAPNTVRNMQALCRRYAHLPVVSAPKKPSYPTSSSLSAP